MSTKNQCYTRDENKMKIECTYNIKLNQKTFNLTKLNKDDKITFSIYFVYKNSDIQQNNLIPECDDLDVYVNYDNLPGSFNVDIHTEDINNIIEMMTDYIQNYIRIICDLYIQFYLKNCGINYATFSNLLKTKISEQFRRDLILKCQIPFSKD